MKSNQPKQKSGVLGLAFDAEDGHKRLTRGKDFLLAGGSEETHGRMQETLIKVGERLEQRGKRISDASTSELRDVFHDVQSTS
ncbi:hypothetical protein Pla123a_28690 [Posidoniimonas polymericola]|uniref:Uncharacterized protein n=1 Tax=Posidoniimonas polymericola TaxID=2528002 RepID=A0A5C5YME9_9BACT|nr:hypothetical protein [Posidoniimonas polymericola]TWT76082.1 hypothetical protein Pla123a_28690 [Posidoniimonas polymericola]